MTPLEHEVLAILHAVERGDVTVTPTQDPASVPDGHVTYRTSTGWTLVVFDDNGSWDYLDEATAPDGRVWEYPVDYDEGRDTALMYYRPPEAISERVWGIPL